MGSNIVTAFVLALCVMCAATFGLIVVGNGYGKETEVVNGDLSSSHTGGVVSARTLEAPLENPFSDEFVAGANWLSVYGDDGSIYRQQILSASKTSCASGATCVNGYSHLYQTSTGYYAGTLKNGAPFFTYVSNSDAQKLVNMEEVKSVTSSGFVHA